MADASPPDSAQAWLARSMAASHCFDFQARAVNIDALGVRTLALSHRIRDGVRQQVVQHLDGPSVSIERRSIAGHMANFAPESGSDLNTAQAWAQHVAALYDITLQADARVAGRDAVKLQFIPRDRQRYQHVWWVDKATGLMLKHVMSDNQEHVLETFQITQLQSPALYQGSVADDVVVEHRSAPWQVAWLPEGFVVQPQEPAHASPEQRLYSDGLAAVSLFVSPAQDDALQEGVYRLGVSTVVTSLVTHGEQRWQLVGVGELPPDMLQRIVRSVRIES